MKVWKVHPNWESGIIHISPNWRCAIPVWLLPAVVAEIFIRFFGGSYIGIIAGIGVALVKSYYDFFILMSTYHPFFKNKKEIIKYKIKSLMKLRY